MAIDDIQRLSEMGITSWQLRRPELFPSHTANTISLPATCKLLLVCDKPLDEHDAWLFSKILASMKLSPEQALTLPHTALTQIDSHHLDWVWYINEPVSGLSGPRSLVSIPLSEMHENPAAKKALWQRICEYEN